MKDLIAVGHTKKLYGVKGGVRVHIEEAYWKDFQTTEVLFLNIDGRKIPYFIQQKITSAPFRVIFEDHTDRATAQALTGKEIFLPKEKLAPPAENNELYFMELQGYTLVDTDAGSIGEILDIQEFPQQEMAVVQYQGQDILIPLHEDLIESIDQDNQIIIVNLPDGLLDLYMS